MMYVSYFFVTVLQLLFTLLAYLLSPILPIFTQSTGYLPGWLTWFQTPDASLDAGWQDGYFTVTGTPTGISLWWLRMRWLWRNPAYGFCVAIGAAYDPADWVIDTLTLAAPGGPITLLKAHTKDGRHFAYTTASGWKLGYKLWWAMDASGNLLPAVPASKCTGNKLPICFTPEI